YLIEEATRIATGSVYCDKDQPVHLPTPFPWGYTPNRGYAGNCAYPARGTIVVLKTHFPVLPLSPFDTLPYTKVIRIVRHPVDSFYSHYLKGSSLSKIPRETLQEFVSSWGNFQAYWNKKPNVVTIRYEDLYNFPRETLKQVLEAIGYRAYERDIQRAVAKYPPQGGIMKYMKLFNKNDLRFLEQELRPYMNQYNYRMDP
ncbi:MAG: hypothetical protein JWO53_244, partial [Chlamydiia bacterium]|nr:hypothetical protein [Chlamydiia bacterium]